jgi:hypothetical protein
LTRTFVPNLKGRACSIELPGEHLLPCRMKPKLFLKWRGLIAVRPRKRWCSVEGSRS